MISEFLQRLDNINKEKIPDIKLAELAGLGKDAIRDLRRKKDRRDINVNTALRLAKYFNVSMEWLVDGPDDTCPTDVKTINAVTGLQGIPDNTIPEIDVRAGMGGGGYMSGELVATDSYGNTYSAHPVADYWRIPAHALGRYNPQNIAVFPCQGDSMFPTINDGDFVFADITHKIPSPPGVYVLADEFGGIVVKRLEVVSSRGDDICIVRVISDNPHHSPRDLPLDELTIIGRYIGRFILN